MRDAYDAVAPDPAHFDDFAARVTAMVQSFPGWTDELRALVAPTLLVFGDRDFSPLHDLMELVDPCPTRSSRCSPGPPTSA